MFDDAFVKYDREASAAILEDVNPLLENGSFDPDKTTILGKDLPFYPGYRFLDITDYETVPSLHKIAVYRQGEAIILDWTNGPVYALNDNVPVEINEKTVLDYVRFFFSCVRGPRGWPGIVETVDDVEWDDEPSPPVRKAVGQVIFPLSIEDRRTDGTFVLNACLSFRSGLYKSRLIVSSQGVIDTAEEEVLLEDMPVLDRILGQ